MGLGALNTGNNLLYLLLGFALATIVVSGVLSEGALKGLSVRRLGTECAFAQEPFAFRWGVFRQRGRSWALTLSEEDCPLTGSGRIAYLPSGAEVAVRANMTAPRRGPLRLKAVRVSTTFPLGLFAKSRLFDLPETLWIYPRRVPPKPNQGDPDGGPLGQRPNPRHADGDGEVVSLRPLREGEDARRIHWLKSATLGKMLRVEREREERASYLIRLPPGLPAEALEPRCEALAALAQQLLRDGHEVGFESGATRLRPASGAHQEKRVLQALARAGYEEAEG